MYNKHALFYTLDNLLMKNIDCFRSARQKLPKSLFLFQKKELMCSFLKKRELTEDTKINLTEKLGITQAQVKHFFQTQCDNYRNESIEACSKLLQGKGSKCIDKSVHTCI